MGEGGAEIGVTARGAGELREVGFFAMGEVAGLATENAGRDVPIIGRR